MAPEQLRDTLQERPFAPFRIVLTDGVGYDIRHPDLLWVGKRTAYVGLTGDPGQTFFERSVKLDLLHITRVEPLEHPQPHAGNGPAA